MIWKQMDQNYMENDVKLMALSQENDREIFKEFKYLLNISYKGEQNFHLTIWNFPKIK